MTDTNMECAIHLANRDVKAHSIAYIMGIVNITPDSFWSTSRGGVELALRLIDEGADILDIGAESTRPGAVYIDSSQEVARLVPVIEGIRAVSDIPISVDTRKAQVLKAALDSGADMLNDISSLEDDIDMAPLCKERGCPVILMHKKGIPETMQDNPIREGAFDTVNSYLDGRVNYAITSGIDESKILVDPGIGFGKDTRASLELIARCGSLCQGKWPIVVGLSRKSFIGELLGRSVDDRLMGSITAAMIAVQKGASVLRVHDVKETYDVLKMLSALDEVSI